MIAVKDSESQAAAVLMPSRDAHAAGRLSYLAASGPPEPKHREAKRPWRDSRTGTAGRVPMKREPGTGDELSSPASLRHLAGREQGQSGTAARQRTAVA